MVEGCYEVISSEKLPVSKYYGPKESPNNLIGEMKVRSSSQSQSRPMES